MTSDECHSFLISCSYYHSSLQISINWGYIGKTAIVDYRFRCVNTSSIEAVDWCIWCRESNSYGCSPCVHFKPLFISDVCKETLIVIGGVVSVRCDDEFCHTPNGRFWQEPIITLLCTFHWYIWYLYFF